MGSSFLLIKIGQTIKVKDIYELRRIEIKLMQMNINTCIR